MEYLHEERRKHFRCSIPYSAFEYKGQLFDILNISAQGLLVENSNVINSTERIDSLLSELLTNKNFDFNLVDKTTDSKLLLNGRIVRTVKNADESSIEKFAIKFSPPSEKNRTRN